jgi:hypothetical protein
VWAVAALFVLVIGGMYGGVFTATEAAAMGAAGTLMLALMRRRLTWAALARALSRTVETSAPRSSRRRACRKYGTRSHGRSGVGACVRPAGSDPFRTFDR